MKKRQKRTRTGAVKLRLTEESVALLDAAGVGLDELARLLVFGRRRRTRAGMEILFDRPPADAALAAQLASLEGLSLLVVGGRIRECRRKKLTSTKQREKEKSDVQSAVRKQRKRQ